VDSTNGIVIGNGDIADDCFPTHNASFWANAAVAEQSTASKANIFFM